MKIRANPAAALTKVEVLIVIVVLAVLAGLLSVSYRDWKKKSDLAQCQGNLKQIVLGFQIWATDRPVEYIIYPWNIPAKEGGTREFIESGEAFRHFLIASNEIGSPKILVCPGDKERRPAANWQNFSNTNLSYFAAVSFPLLSFKDGRCIWWESRDEIVAGDRHITGGTLTDHLLTFESDTPAGWKPTIHGGSGNIGYFSGSVRSMTTNQLREDLKYWERSQVYWGGVGLLMP